MRESPSSSHVTYRDDGPPAWFLDKHQEIDWDQVRLLRKQQLATMPRTIVPNTSVPSFPRWPCLLCKVTFKSALSVHTHVLIAHKKCHDFFLETPEFFTRCIVCCEYYLFVKYFVIKLKIIFQNIPFFFSSYTR